MFDNIIGPVRPVSWAGHFWPVLLVSFTGSFFATWLFKKVALKFGIVDRPDATVKTHRRPIAYLGGVGILVGLTGGWLFGIIFFESRIFSGQTLRLLAGIIFGSVIACFVGLTDDLFEIKPWQKIIGELVAAGALLLAGIRPELGFLNSHPLNLPIPDYVLSVLEVLTVIIFVLGATNSLNLLDGLDGLCAGVTTIITVSMLLLAIHLSTWGFSDTGDPVRIVVCLGLIGSVCGFLPFNRYPAKIFMGDAGSILLGFVLASLMIMFAEGIPRWWLASVVVFGLPILDTAVALVRRVLNRKPLFLSDRGHIYDQMIDRGIPLKKTVAINYTLAGVYALIGLFMSQIRTRYAAVVYVLVFVVSAVIVWRKGYFRMEGIRGAIRHKNR